MGVCVKAAWLEGIRDQKRPEEQPRKETQQRDGVAKPWPALLWSCGGPAPLTVGMLLGRYGCSSL
jgi:hypothetical protein